MAEVKKWYESKTLWVGFLQVLAGVIMGLAGELQVGGTLTATGIVSIILRVVTKTAII